MKAEAATYYIDGQTGLDTNLGTIGSPWQNISKAASTLVAGDIVNVKGNQTYQVNNLTTTNLGADGNRITYQAWSGTGIPTLTATGLGADIFNLIKGYHTFIGFRFSGADLKCVDLAVRTYFFNNIFENCTQYAVSLGSGGPSILYNNVFYNNGGAFWQNAAIRTSTTSTVKNNIIVNNYAGIEYFGGTLTEDYNLYYNNTDGDSQFDAFVIGANSITGQDPMLVDAGNGNFTLDPSSPGVNVGETNAEATPDIVGVARPQGAAYDIGAYEHYDQTVSVDAITPNPTTDTTPTVTGSVSTIAGATISTVQYKIDSGSWVTSGMVADDAAFDEQSEAFTLTIPGGSALSDGAHTIYVRIGTDSYGTRSSADSEAVTVDTAGPTVTNVTSTTANGTYKTGALIVMTVQFDESSIVTGTPQLTLNTNRTIDYLSGSGTDTLTFNYTVQSGDNSTDLDYAATNSLTLNSGTIKDDLNNSAVLTLATPGLAGSLGFNKNIVIDTSAPSGVVITDIGLIDDVPNLEDLYYYFTSEEPEIKGSCEVGGTVYFTNINTSDVYSTTCSGSGTFTLVLDSPSLERDLNELNYYQKDIAGNSSAVRTLTLVIGVENFPEWLLVQLGLSPDTVTPETEVNEEDLDGQNDQQDDVQDSMDEDYDLPGTGEEDDEKDTRTEEEKDADRQKELIKDLLICGIPLVVLLVLLGAGFYFLGKPKKEIPSTQKN